MRFRKHLLLTLYEKNASVFIHRCGWNTCHFCSIVVRLAWRSVHEWHYILRLELALTVKRKTKGSDALPVNCSSLERGARWLSTLLPMARAVLRSNIHAKRCFKIITFRWQACFWMWTMEMACEFRIQQALPAPPRGGSWQSWELPTLLSDTDRIVRRLSETKQPSSWRPSEPRSDGHCRFQVLCTEDKESGLSGHLTPSGNVHIHVTSSLWAPMSVVLSYYNIIYLHGFAQCQRENVALRNKSLITFLW